MSSPPASPKKTIAFLGASTGCGLAALREALAAGHSCVALCRTPSKLTDKLPAAAHPNLTVLPGNAHDAAAVRACLVVNGGGSGEGGRGRLVDAVLFSIGSVFVPSRMTIEDPHVCADGIAAVLRALREAREAGAAAGGGSPTLVAVSTNGISRAGRDYPLLMAPFYRLVLRAPHADKRVLEERLAGSGERYAIVRPSLLVDGAEESEGEGGGSGGKRREVRVGVEDWEKGLEKREVGYAISREEVGRWIYENLLGERAREEYGNKIVSITW